MEMRDRLKARARSASGQTLLEFAMMIPIMVVLLLGVIDISFALLDQHVVSKLSREGANMISRNVSIADATNALRTMSTRPVNFDTGATVIFSVVWRDSNPGAANYNKDILFQRRQFGAIPATSTLLTVGAGSFGGAPDYRATNPDQDGSLVLTNFPPTMNVLDGLVYVAEIFSNHILLTPIGNFGMFMPSRLYSIAYF
jgi:hypothetical protein